MCTWFPCADRFRRAASCSLSQAVMGAGEVRAVQIHSSRKRRRHLSPWLPVLWLHHINIHIWHLHWSQIIPMIRTKSHWLFWKNGKVCIWFWIDLFDGMFLISACEMSSEVIAVINIRHTTDPLSMSGEIVLNQMNKFNYNLLLCA